MVQPNDVIAIIIITIFSLLILITFGIYRLVNSARGLESDSSSLSFLDDEPQIEVIN